MTDSTEASPTPQPEAASAPDRSGQQDALSGGSTLQAGALLLQHVLSQSHFGITYRGEDTRLQRPVAVKEFFPDGCIRHEREVHPHGTLSATAFQLARNRFLDEARVLARFRHPNIVHVYTFFEENNTAYMVMEYIEGETLLERVSRLGRLQENDAVHYILQAGEALEEVHLAHLLHCDVKPDNIILCKSNSDTVEAEMLAKRRIVLVDFGLSTHLEERANYLTRPLSPTGHFGTPGYAPLEQYTQQVALGIPTDIYALGATLYHLLTGQTPTPSADRAYGVDLVPPHQVHDDINPVTGECVMWAMQLRAEQRPQTMRAFIERLRTGLDSPQPVVIEHPSTLSEHPSTPPEHQSTPPVTPVQPAVSQSAAPRLAPANQDYEEQGCLEAAFITFLVLWSISLVVYLLWFFIHTITFGIQ